MRIVRYLALGLTTIAALAVVTLALPVRSWRNGEVPLPPLAYDSNRDASLPHRIWIDTDAACGAGQRVDPDDCLAIAALANVPRLEIAGISTVFGNAPRTTVERTVRELIARHAAAGAASISVHTGANAPISGQTPSLPAVSALQAALEQGPLTIVALGPLTNVAAALLARADLRSNVQGVVAVMGRRPGHLFHPAEGVRAQSWLGHGPVFRDFNVAVDTQAAAAVIALQLPLVFLPYEAARRVEITAADLARIGRSAGAQAWAATRSRAWLNYWTNSLGRRGFYPFDWIAAAYVIDPRRFACASVTAWFGDDPLQYFPSLMPAALLVERGGVQAGDGVATTAARYCRPDSDDFKPWLVDSLAKGSNY
jgi:inosine-uridine nucleoside N-ribohydrolase